jgi:hypothetical protein
MPRVRACQVRTRSIIAPYAPRSPCCARAASGHPLAALPRSVNRAALRRLERAGKLTYVDDDVRERYQTMKRAGLFG